MSYGTILVKKTEGRLTVTFNRLASRNSINEAFLGEINAVLDEAEKDDLCRVVVLEGQNGVFCTGMDFEEAATFETQGGTDGRKPFSPLFMETVKRFSLIPRVIISKVDGQVIAGGVGIVAASDLVVATPRSQFALSEALWGLLPAMVLPYLIRRIGFQKAYGMTLTTLPVPAEEAYRIHLVDELSEEPDGSIERLCRRLMKLELSTIGNIKEYFRKMWIVTGQMEQTAVDESGRLVSEPLVQENIRNFLQYRKFPWENR